MVNLNFWPTEPRAEDQSSLFFFFFHGRARAQARAHKLVLSPIGNVEYMLFILFIFILYTIYFIYYLFITIYYYTIIDPILPVARPYPYAPKKTPDCDFIVAAISPF